MTIPSSPYPLEVHPSIWRRLFHMAAGSSIPVAAIFLSSGTMVVATSVLAGTALLVEGVRLKLPRLNSLLVARFGLLLKKAESRKVTGATYFVLSALAVFLLFDEHVAIASLLFLSLGDPAAALVGRRAPGMRFFGKSPVGTLAMVLVALGIAVALPAAGVGDRHWGLYAGAVAAGLAELLPLPLDDNLTIPLVSGGAMALLVAV